jgi:hypothetical protein
MLKVLQKCKHPSLLVVTPLLPDHKISKETKISLQRNIIDFDWVSYSSNNLSSHNQESALEEYLKKYPKQEIKYVMVIDNDIIASRNMLYKMYSLLERAPKDVAYCYCNFEFKGYINKSFKHIPYDALRLLNQNYISMNSMIKIDKLKEIGGFKADPKINRLQDWALWLRFLNAGYFGILCDDTSFIAVSKIGDASSRSQENFNENYLLIRDLYVQPMTEGLIF